MKPASRFYAALAIATFVVALGGTLFLVASPAALAASAAPSNVPPEALAIGLGAAVDYVQKLGLREIEAHDQAVLTYAIEGLSQIKKLKIIGGTKDKGPILSFVVEGAHPQDIASIVDHEGIAIRTGHHCTQPLLAKFDLTATARASFSLYSTKGDVDALVLALDKAIYMLG